MSKISSLLLCSFAFFCFAVLYAVNSYPNEWNNVEIGMTQHEIHEICGPPSNSSWQDKGDFWRLHNVIGQWELKAFNGGDGVRSTQINLIIGREKPHTVRLKKDGKWDIRL